MRLLLGCSDCFLNTNFFDEQGNVLYSVSTPFAFFSRKTTLRKWNRDSKESVEELMGTIVWPRLFRNGLFEFDGKVIPVNKMFMTSIWSSGFRFSGPDEQTHYKWKMSPRRMKIPGSSDQLVRYHPKNLGIRKPFHQAYLDVSDSPEIVSMLDLIVITFIYAEWKYQQNLARRRALKNLGIRLVRKVITLGLD